MIRRPPRSTLDRSSAASDVYKRQGEDHVEQVVAIVGPEGHLTLAVVQRMQRPPEAQLVLGPVDPVPVSYTHLRAHETVLDLVCRLLLETHKT